MIFTLEYKYIKPCNNLSNLIVISINLNFQIIYVIKIVKI